MVVIPSRFARSQVELYGTAGAEWLKRLPILVAECEQRWSLTVGAPFEPLSYNYVAPAVRTDGADVVLKVGFPNPELLSEIEALRICAGRGIVRLLDSDHDQGVMLLERLKPGTPLLSIMDDQRVTSIAVQVMQQLWRPAPFEHSFPTVEKWAAGFKRLRQRFNGGTGPLPARLVEEAEQLFEELIGSMDEPMLLHGDLHHDNILAAERQPWLALDPKGLVGEPAYEVGALLRNKLPQNLKTPQASRILRRRIDRFAEELGFDRQRLCAWGLAQAVLSAWWSIEDHGYGWEEAMACAELLSAQRH